MNKSVHDYNGFAVVDVLNRLRNVYEKNGRMSTQDLRLYSEALKSILYNLSNEVPGAFEYIKHTLNVLEIAKKIDNNEKLF
jgi:hypothetical protein